MNTETMQSGVQASHAVTTLREERIITGEAKIKAGQVLNKEGTRQEVGEIQASK